MSYEATRTGAYQTAIKAADAMVAVVAQNSIGAVSQEHLLKLHETVRRAVYEDVKVVVERDIEDAKSRPQPSGGGGGRRSGGGGQSSIPTDGSTMFGQKQDDGSIKGGGAAAGLTIAQVAALSGEQMQDRGIGDGSKTGLAYLKGLLEFDGYKNDYMKRRIKAFFDAQNTTPAQAQEVPAQAAPAAEAAAELDESFTFPEN